MKQSLSRSRTAHAVTPLRFPAFLLRSSSPTTPRSLILKCLHPSDLTRPHPRQALAQVTIHGGRSAHGPQVAYPILLGRPHPVGHPAYPGMGSFFVVQAGGGRYPDQPSPPTSRAAVLFLERRLGLPPHVLKAAEQQSVAETLRSLTAVQVTAPGRGRRRAQIRDRPTRTGPS